MDRVFQALIDRSRALLDLKTIKTILGYKHRPKYRRGPLAHGLDPWGGKRSGRMAGRGRETYV
jgi:hypothetical protein